MRILILALVALLPLCSMAQQLGRLPGSIYPSDRGARSFATLETINTVSRPAFNWYFDGTWPISGDFAFKAGDIIHMLPGANFILHTNNTLDFANAEFIAPRHTCFYGTGTVVNIKYPHLFPEWYGLTNEFGLPSGYADYPVAFSNVQQNFNYTNKLGNTNLLEHLRYIDLHIDDHTRAGFASTQTVTGLTNSIAQLYTNSVADRATVTNLLGDRFGLDLLATNGPGQIFYPSLTTCTNWLWEYDIGSAFNPTTGVYTVVSNGYYNIVGAVRGVGTGSKARDVAILVDGGVAARQSFYTTMTNAGATIAHTAKLSANQTVALGFYFEDSTGHLTNRASSLSITHVKQGSLP